MIFVLSPNQPSLLSLAQNYNFLQAIAELFGIAKIPVMQMDKFELMELSDEELK